MKRTPNLSGTRATSLAPCPQCPLQPQDSPAHFQEFPTPSYYFKPPFKPSNLCSFPECLCLQQTQAAVWELCVPSEGTELCPSILFPEGWPQPCLLPQLHPKFPAGNSAAATLPTHPLLRHGGDTRDQTLPRASSTPSSLPLHPQTAQIILFYCISKPQPPRAGDHSSIPPAQHGRAAGAAGKAVDAGMRRGLIHGAALTAPKSDPDLQPRLNSPGKMGFVQWEPTRIKTEISQDLGTGPATYPLINKSWVKRRGNNPDRAVLLHPEGPELPEDAEPSPEIHPTGRS